MIQKFKVCHKKFVQYTNGAYCPLIFFRMVRNYKKKDTGSRKSYADSEAMAAAYNSVMAKEMSSNQAAKHYGVDKKSCCAE